MSIKENNTGLSANEEIMWRKKNEKETKREHFFLGRVLWRRSRSRWGITLKTLSFFSSFCCCWCCCSFEPFFGCYLWRKTQANCFVFENFFSFYHVSSFARVFWKLRGRKLDAIHWGALLSPSVGWWRYYGDVITSHEDDLPLHCFFLTLTE